MMIKRRIRYFLDRNIIRIYGAFHKVEKKVLFKSFGGKQYSDNPRAISEKLHELYPDYKIVWSLNTKNDSYGVIPDYIEIVKPRSIEYYKTLATAVSLVSNTATETNVYKKENQFFIQTWHGDRGFKKVLYDCEPEGQGGIPITDNDVTNLCIAASPLGEKVYHTAFRYSGDILSIGMPRNDKLVSSTIVEEKIIKDKIGITENIKILLYAPTFRDNINKLQDSTVDLKMTISNLEKKGEKWICLVRAHSASRGLNIECDGSNYIDVSAYPDMADLLQIADMLITDYSSCAGDFILRKKAVILAHFDRDMYIENCRGFNINIEESGFLIANNQDELNSIIETMSDTDYSSNCEKIIKYFSINETGKSSEEICKRIDEFYNKNCNNIF